MYPIATAPPVSMSTFDGSPKVKKIRKKSLKKKTSEEPAPEYWPKKIPWPLKNGVKIVAIFESLPPVFELSNHKKVYGEKRIEKKSVKKSRKLKKR